ncbi:MAG TPA: DUF805 domain-containing protein [Xanthobacteraceae bacterium]|nr:DUF805 domain-containing protein [Xanthobacteraceae bacterium]
MHLRSLLFSFEGRINRAKYWLAGLIYLIGAMLYLTTSVYALAGSLRDTDSARVVLFPILVYAVTYPLFAVGMWTFAATTIKRLRDRNKTGWWIVPFFVFPMLIGEVGDRLAESNAALLIGLVAFVLSIWAFVETFCLRGTRGPNRFGSDPLARGNMRIDRASPARA